MKAIKIGDVYRHLKMGFVFIVTDLEKGVSSPNATLLFIKSSRGSNIKSEPVKVSLSLITRSVFGTPACRTDYEKLA